MMLRRVASVVPHLCKGAWLPLLTMLEPFNQKSSMKYPSELLPPCCSTSAPRVSSATLAKVNDDTPSCYSKSKLIARSSWCSATVCFMYHSKESRFNAFIPHNTEIDRWFEIDVGWNELLAVADHYQPQRSIAG